MTQIPGVFVKKNAAGKITHVTIDVEQQKELARPVLEQLEPEDDLELEESLHTTLELVDRLFDTNKKNKN